MSYSSNSFIKPHAKYNIASNTTVKIDMTIALVCIAKNEDPYIEEWINYHLKLGFDNIIIYANDWQYSSKYKSVKIIPITGKTQQFNAYKHFIYGHNKKSQYKWAAFLDVDEFIVLHQHNNIKNLLTNYSNCNAIGINWAVFGNNAHTSYSIEDTSVLKRFTKRSSQKFYHNKLIKSILQFPINKTKKARKQLVTNPHNIAHEWYNLKKQKQRGPYAACVDWSIAQINHYFTKSTEEFVSKCNRGRADTDVKRNIKDYEDFLNANEIEDIKAKTFMYGDTRIHPALDNTERPI